MGFNIKFLYTNPFNGWLVLILMAVIATNMNFQFPCLTTIKHDLRASEFMIQLTLVLGPGLAILSNIFFGLWVGRFRHKVLLIYCVTLFLLGSLLCALSYSILPFFIGRAMQVFGDSGISVIGFVILSDLCRNRTGEFLGYNAALTAAFNICAPIIGAYILIHVDWRMNFWLLFCLSLALLILLYYSLPPGDQPEKDLQITLKGLTREYITQLKSPPFFLSITIPAMCATLTTLQDFYSPVFYIEIHRTAPQVFSYIRGLLIIISIISSLLYVFTLKRKGVKPAFIIGSTVSIFHTLGVLITLLLPAPHGLYPFFLLASVQFIAAGFLNPLGMLKAIVYFPDRKGISLSIFALMRNVISTFITVLAAFIFNGSIEPIIFIIGIISIALCYLLFLMSAYIG